jgi:hypothetical protein
MNLVRTYRAQRAALRTFSSQHSSAKKGTGEAMKVPLSVEIVQCWRSRCLSQGVLVEGPELRIGHNKQRLRHNASGEIERDYLRCRCGGRVIPVSPARLLRPVASPDRRSSRTTARRRDRAGEGGAARLSIRHLGSPCRPRSYVASCWLGAWHPTHPAIYSIPSELRMDEKSQALGFVIVIGRQHCALFR